MVVVALLARGPPSLEAILGRRGLFSDPWKKKFMQIDASGKEGRWKGHFGGSLDFFTLSRSSFFSFLVKAVGSCKKVLS